MVRVIRLSDCDLPRGELFSEEADGIWPSDSSDGPGARRFYETIVPVSSVVYGKDLLPRKGASDGSNRQESG